MKSNVAEEENDRSTYGLNVDDSIIDTTKDMRFLRSLQSIGCDSTGNLADVCIIIDPLYDFLSPDGTFCKTYGAEDCKPILNLKKELNGLYKHLMEQCPTVDIIIVSSTYAPCQFETIHNLCSSSKGCQVLLDECPVNASACECGNQIYVVKTENSIMSCNELDAKRLQNMVRNRNVMVCGLTTTSCISAAVHDLCCNKLCQNVIVARNVVASRARNSRKEVEVFQIWRSCFADQVQVYNEWQRVFR